MPERFTESYIRHIPMFQNLPPDILSRIVPAFQARRYNAGEVIFNEGEETRGMHLIIEGQALMWQVDPARRQQQFIGTLMPGHHVNETALFRDMNQTVTLQAREPVLALLLTREHFLRLVAQDDEIKRALGLHGSSAHKQDKTGIRFKQQRDDEHVLLKTRRHWWAWVRWFPIPIGLAVILLIIAALAPTIAGIMVPLAVLVPSTILAYMYVEWANDLFIITDQRVIRINENILFFRQSVQEVALESIQQTSVRIPSGDPFAVIMRYGTLELLTAGEAGNFTLDLLPNPQSVQEIVLDEYERRNSEMGMLEEQNMRAELEKWLSGGEVNPSDNDNGKAANRIAEGPPLLPFKSTFLRDDGGVVYRKHWLIWLRGVFIPGVVAIASFLGVIAGLFIPNIGAAIFAASMVAFIIAAGWFYFEDWDWRNDYLLLQDTTITIVHRRPFFLQNESDQILLEQIDNVIADSQGVFQRLLNFGDIRVSAEGADELKVFNSVPNPVRVQGDITRRQSRQRREEENARERSQRETIGRYFSLFNERLQNQQGEAPAPATNMTPGQPYRPQAPYQQPAQRPPYQQPYQQPQQQHMPPTQPYQQPQQQQPYQQPYQQPPQPPYQQPYQQPQQQHMPPTQPSQENAARPPQMPDRSRPPRVIQQQRGSGDGPRISQGTPYRPSQPQQPTMPRYNPNNTPPYQQQQRRPYPQQPYQQQQQPPYQQPPPHPQQQPPEPPETSGPVDDRPPKFPRRR